MKKILSILTIISLILFPFPVKAETLSDYFMGRLPSVMQRVPLAQECGITNYTGTAEQNIKLLACLKAKDAALMGVSDEPMLGAGYTPITGYQSRTTQSISASVTTIPVVHTNDLAGNQIVLANISSAGTVKVYLTLASGSSSKQESIVCTGLTATSWTNCTRGLSFQGSSETSSTTLAKVHNAGTSIIITNIGQFHNQYVSIDGDQTINDTKTFSTIPLIPTTTPTLPNQAVSFSYLASTTYAGTVDASTLVKGIGELATITEASSTAALGSGNTTAALLLHSGLSGGIPSTVTSTDQSQLSTDSTFTLSSSQSFGQQFLPTQANFAGFTVRRGSSGTSCGAPVGRLWTTSGSVPGTALATSTISMTSSTWNALASGTDVFFPFNRYELTVDGSTKYFFSVFFSGGSGNCLLSLNSNAASYSAGGAATHNGVSWSSQTFDLLFRTHYYTGATIPVSRDNGSISSYYGGVSSSLATLDANTLVVQNPANATTTVTDAKIPIQSSSKLVWGSATPTTSSIPIYSGSAWTFPATTTGDQVIRSSSTTVAAWGTIGVNVVTSTKALSTVYQNTSGKTRIAYVSVRMAPGNSAGNTLTCIGRIGPTSSPTIVLSSVEQSNNLSATNPTNVAHMFTIVVPNNYYYEANCSGTGTNTLLYWTEFDL